MRRAQGAPHIHYNNMRQQVNPLIIAPLKKKAQKYQVQVRIKKRAQSGKKIVEKLGGRKVVQWEVTCNNGLKYYVCAVSRENALAAACRLKIPAESILSVEVYNDPISGRKQWKWKPTPSH